MKFEAGKCYRMRNGRKAQIDHVDGDVDSALIGIYWDSYGIKQPSSWNQTGLFHQKIGETCLDLIEPWDEPVKIWINVVNKQHGASWSERRDITQDYLFSVPVEITDEQARALGINVSLTT